MLLTIIEEGKEHNFSLLVIGIVACAALRNFFMGKQIQRVTSTPMWNTDLPRDKREALFVVITNTTPTDINKFDDMSARYVTLPNKIAMAVMYGIVNMLHAHLGEEDKMKLMGAFAVFIMGGIGIGGTRHGSLVLDCLFRCAFWAGFIAVLHYLAEVADIVLIKSMN